MADDERDHVRYDFPAEDVVTYQFDIPKEDWRAWKRTLPKDAKVFQRLRDLIVADVGDIEPVVDGERVQKTFYANRDVYEEWVDTVPRSQSVDEQIQTLIMDDLRSAKRARNGDIEDASVQLLASRIRIRSMQALGSIRPDDEDSEIDTETAIEELREVIELADALES